MLRSFKKQPIYIDALKHGSTPLLILKGDGEIEFLNDAAAAFLDGCDLNVGDDIKSALGEMQARQLLNSASENQSAITVTLKDCAFDVKAIPLGTGFLLEWADSGAREQVEVLKSQAEALDQTTAVISFEPTGIILEANANFLAAAQYTMDEIRGKHHRIFVFEDDQSTPEYQRFWQELAAGDLKTAEIRRRNKSGQEVWLQATYHPIKNAQGEVFKVIKFASDITADVHLRQKAHEAQTEIIGGLGTVNEAVNTLSDKSELISASSTDMSEQVHSVAQGVDELVASIGEINTQSVEASRISGQAADQAANTTSIVAGLTEATGEIENVVRLISDIAEQTNLLALNATIEAARAGEAGKGFAVVAAEVKELANQTAKATGEISQKIEAVQSSTGDAVAAIETISETIDRLNQINAIISSAVEEQSATTASMSGNMKSAAEGVQVITDGMNGIVEANDKVRSSANHVQQSAAALK